MKPHFGVLKTLPSMAVLVLLSFLVGCAGLQYNPTKNGRFMYYPREFPAAERAVEAARQAGKDRECPDEFRAAEKKLNDAYATYDACHTKEGIAMAIEAANMANAPCPQKAAAPPPPPAPSVSLSANPATIQQGQCTNLAWSSTNATSASIDQGVGSVDPNGSRQTCPGSTTDYMITATGAGGSRTAAARVTVNPPPPPPAPAPSVSLSANPATILQGQCTNLAWSSTNATSASIDQGVGSVDPNGSRQTCPGSTTNYMITATGAGGSQTAAATVTVNPPPPPALKVIDRLTLHVNFDFDKSVIREPDVAELQKAVDFVKKYPGHQISIEGHTDWIGTDKYNQALSERRAAAVKAYLVKAGVADDQHIKTVGYGESRPIADNKTKQGRFENRRVEILILSE
jgi:outer membrane protein OmpA-like peptidoglycan-associated protein